jgi:hypothetical protein
MLVLTRYDPGGGSWVLKDDLLKKINQGPLLDLL